MIATGTRIDPPEAGTFTSAGLAGAAVTFSSTQSAATYHISVIFTANPSGGAGEWWIGGKTTAGFIIYTSGLAGITGTWSMVRY